MTDLTSELLYWLSAAEEVPLVIVTACSKAYTSFWPLRATDRAMFQLAAVKVKEVAFAVAVDVSEEAILPIVTLAVGLLVKTTV